MAYRHEPLLWWSDKGGTTSGAPNPGANYGKRGHWPLTSPTELHIQQPGSTSGESSSCWHRIAINRTRPQLHDLWWNPITFLRRWSDGAGGQPLGRDLPIRWSNPFSQRKVRLGAHDAPKASFNFSGAGVVYVRILTNTGPAPAPWSYHQNLGKAPITVPGITPHDFLLRSFTVPRTCV